MTIKRHQPKCDCVTCKPPRVGDVIEFWEDYGDAESGPRPAVVAANVEDIDETYILYESPWDGEPALMRRDVPVRIIPQEELVLDDGPDDAWPRRASLGSID
jgi:hypothetical protein